MDVNMLQTNNSSLCRNLGPSGIWVKIFVAVRCGKMYDCKDRQRFLGVMANFYSRRQRVDSGCISSNRLSPVHMGITAWFAAKMPPMCVRCRLGGYRVYGCIWVESRTVSNSTLSPASFFSLFLFPFAIQNLFRKCISFRVRKKIFW